VSTPSPHSRPATCHTTYLDEKAAAASDVNEWRPLGDRVQTPRRQQATDGKDARTHDVYEEPRDATNASSVGIWIDEAERSTLFLSRPLE
jgi:hypothetical protein